ncbi:MAG: NAD(P)-dependent oxidoreductase [Rhizobiaceae bacterium]|nr:NAD(P)-dependent oxidoreductase [Rhizobiaceae bacterium]
MKQSVGVIGVGLMGHGIAKNIVTKGWSLSYLRHDGNQSTDDLDQAGARGRDTTAELAAECDIVILCVTGSPQVEDVLLGSGRLLDAVRAGTLIIDCSTAQPDSTVALAAKVAERGARFIDAAMTRTPKEAEEGRLNLLVGGDAETLESVRPLLSAFAENIFHAGGVGTGHQLKLLHNFVSLGSATLIAEAAACAAKGGVSMDTFVDCLARGGGNGVALDRMKPYILSRETDQFRFSIGNAHKDIGYYRDMTATMHVANAVAEGVFQTLDGLVKSGSGNALMPEQIDLLK